MDSSSYLLSWSMPSSACPKCLASMTSVNSVQVCWETKTGTEEESAPSEVTLAVSGRAWAKNQALWGCSSKLMTWAWCRSWTWGLEESSCLLDLWMWQRAMLRKGKWLISSRQPVNTLDFSSVANNRPKAVEMWEVQVSGSVKSFWSSIHQYY